MCAAVFGDFGEKVSMPCYVCDQKQAVGLRKYEVGRMVVRVWLCSECIQLDKQQILENALGIETTADHQ